MNRDLQDLTDRLTAFRDERDWRQFHSLKNLVLSLNLEASELLELMQWKSDDQAEAALQDDGFHARLAEECADVLIYLLLVCERAGIDPVRAASDKIRLNAEKYPVAASRGNARKYTDL